MECAAAGSRANPSGQHGQIASAGIRPQTDTMTTGMRRRNILRTSVAPPIALATRRCAAAQPSIYRPDWNSIDRRPTPRWYSEVKFGIFIHWGVYSVPAFAAVNVKMKTFGGGCGRA